MKTNRIPIKELAHLPGRAAFTVSRARDQVGYYSNHTGRWELYAMSLKDLSSRQLTHGEAPRALTAGLAWGRDDRTLYYARDENGNEHNNLFAASLDEGTVRQLNQDPDTQDYVWDTFDDKISVLASSTRNGQVNLFRYYPGDSQWIQLTHFANPVQVGIISPGGHQIAFRPTSPTIWPTSTAI